MKKFTGALVASLAMGAVSMVQAQTAADNTRQNSTDAMNTAASADTQRNDKTDLALTRQIRQRVMADKSLSTNAHNIKIVADKGNVTLDGPVRSQGEKDSIEAKARAVVQNGSVINNLKIAP